MILPTKLVGSGASILPVLRLINKAPILALIFISFVYWRFEKAGIFTAAYRSNLVGDGNEKGRDMTFGYSTPGNRRWGVFKGLIIFSINCKLLLLACISASERCFFHDTLFLFGGFTTSLL